MQLVFKPAVVPTYTNRPMPAERHIPFKKDAPNFSEDGSLQVDNFSEQNWQSCEAYLYAIDLFNQGYWWEAHEILKPVCYAVGRESVSGVFVEGLIQIAAGELKHSMQEEKGAQILIERGLSTIATAQPVFLGIDIVAFSATIRDCLRSEKPIFPRIKLIF